VEPIRQKLAILFMQILNARSPAKVVSKSLIVLSIASTTRLLPFKASTPSTSPAMRDGCTNLTQASFIFLKVSLNAVKRSGKKLRKK
jgi:hypothetical protein